MIQVGFRIPHEIDEYAEESSRRFKVHKSVVLREILRIGWERICDEKNG